MEDRGLKMEDGQSAPVVRLFVAISLPEAVKDEIEKAQKEMRSALPGNFMRWTKREQFHLTLKFLGNVAVSRVAELTEVLRAACASFSALRLCAERVGFFPDMRFPRVAWIGVGDEKEMLPHLQQIIESNVNRLMEENSAVSGSAGIPPARRRRSQGVFTGHVTLARIQGIRRTQAEILSGFALGMTERFFGEWVADRVELIRSELSSGGARYTTLAGLPLSGAK